MSSQAWDCSTLALFLATRFSPFVSIMSNARRASEVTLVKGFLGLLLQRDFPSNMMNPQNAVPGAVTLKNNPHEGLLELIPPIFIQNNSCISISIICAVHLTTKIVKGRNKAATTEKNSMVSPWTIVKRASLIDAKPWICSFGGKDSRSYDLYRFRQ